MIQTSEAFRQAIVGSPREIELLAVVDISDPDKEMLPTTSSGEAPWSRGDQLYDYEIDDPPRYATLEDGLWLLDGTFDLFPDDYRVPEYIGFAGNALSGSSGAFSSPQWVQMNFRGVRILQAVSLFFLSDPVYGVPMDFTVQIWSNNQLVHTETVAGNTDSDVMVRGFKVYDPTRARITITQWSLPYRRVRMMEFVIGFFERWKNDDIYTFTATLQGQFSCLSLPYGSVTLAMDNADRRFEPRNKDSVFESIEERQGIDLSIGCRTKYGMERVKIGRFYQTKDGWRTSSNDLALKWYLVDIVGLISDRTFIVPDELPTTLEGWIKALVSQLGVNFENQYIVDPDYANRPVVANGPEDVTGKKCGDILRWACQASGTWPRADQETGRLTAEPLWNEGNKYTLDNLNTYPTMKANNSLAALIFQLALPPVDLPAGETDDRVREFVVSGNSTTSEQTVTIINPFIHSSDEALAAAKLILAQYGGNLYELTGRGDPSSEIGDVDTIWLDESSAATARRMSQTFQFQNGVMQGCRSTLLQADGSYLWTEFEVIRESGIFTAPTGVRQLRIVLGQGGQGGGPGGPGWIGLTGNLGMSMGAGYGDSGVDGQGGAIWYGAINCNEGQQFQVRLGAGGAAGSKVGEAGSFGEHTTFGVYTSENGRVYENGYTDIANGQAFARTGVPEPLPGTGDGGKGGAGGDPGEGYIKWVERNYGGSLKPELIVTKDPGNGDPGVPGATGFAMVTWDKPESEGETS